MTYEAFVEDSKTQDAVIRNLEILGEATKKLSEKLRAEHPGMPWKGMAGVRDRLIHQYFGVTSKSSGRSSPSSCQRLPPSSRTPGTPA